MISTHTLTWSVTFQTAAEEYIKIISTHTLTWSVTQCVIIHFVVLHISTHTLTWSVTVKYRKTDFVKGNFNSHAHVERDAVRYS